MRIIYLIISIISFIAFMTIDFVLGDEMMNGSIKLTKEFLKLPDFFNGYFWIFTIPVYLFILGGVFLFLYYLNKKYVAFKMFLFYFINYYLFNFLKMLYSDTRPCFEDALIAEKSCSCSYGMPSGHSSSAFIFYSMFYYEILSLVKNKILRTFYLVLTIFIIINVCLSRIYFGAHSYN